MASARETPPPPIIGKVGRYTVFITPPRTPKPSEAPTPQSASPRPGISAIPAKVAPLPEKVTPSPSPVAAVKKVAPFPEKAPPSPSPVSAPSPPPVQVPPLQFEKPTAKSSGSVFGFFLDAVAKVQDAHSSLDEYLADWFGLNQSKYQWALNDYYESRGKEKEGGRGSESKEVVSKEQAV